MSDEGIFYISEGNPSDKSQNSSILLSASLHSSKTYQSFRQCSSHRNGFTFIDGFHSKLIIACPNKALIQVYAYGKESPEQRIPVPEELISLASCKHPNSGRPWLLAGASKTGRLYIWELSSGFLLQVKEIHYQTLGILKFSENGEFIISGSADSRVVVWKVLDLINGLDDQDNHSKPSKPYAVFTDHTLPVTGIQLTNGTTNDLKLYTSSEDCTIRCYDLHTKSLLTTFVTAAPVQSMVLDPAERALYYGTSTGLIRLVQLYVVDPHTRILEKVGGNSKLITLDNDPELKNTFVHHQGSAVTSLLLSVDGSYICSGDASGKVYISDVVLRQNLNKFKELPFGVSGIYTFLHNDKSQKQLRYNYTLPVLKRVLISQQDLVKHDVMGSYSAVSSVKKPFNLQEFIDQAKEEELVFTNLSDVSSTVTTSGAANGSNGVSSGSAADKLKIEELESQILALTKGYGELREIHEQLFKEHSELLAKGN